MSTEFVVEAYPMDLSNGARGRWTRSGDLLVLHDSPAGPECAVLVRLSGFRAPYALETADPLTIAPRIVCPACRLSADLRNDVWTPF